MRRALLLSLALSLAGAAGAGETRKVYARSGGWTLLGARETVLPLDGKWYEYTFICALDAESGKAAIWLAVEPRDDRLIVIAQSPDWTFPDARQDIVLESDGFRLILQGARVKGTILSQMLDRDTGTGTVGLLASMGSRTLVLRDSRNRKLAAFPFKGFAQAAAALPTCLRDR